MISVIVPAHNEESVITRCLSALVTGARPGEIEVIVVCNGCRDGTARAANTFGQPVRVIETDVPSKTNALNLGDEASSGFPRLYVDADVVLPIDSVRAIAAALERPGVLAAAPAVRTVYPRGTTWSVRAFYSFWMALPYIREGMMGAGVYSVNRLGRQRFNKFPDVIADDGFFRAQYRPSERVEVPSAQSVVSAPGRLRDLIKIKTRSRLGFYQLRSRFPELFAQEASTKDYRGAFLSVLRRPALWPAVVPYVWVNLASRWRAKRQGAALDRYVWERDETSRRGVHGATDIPAGPGLTTAEKV